MKTFTNAFQVNFVQVWREANKVLEEKKAGERKTAKISSPVRLSHLRYYTKFVAAIPKEGFQARVDDFKGSNVITASDGETVQAVQIKALLMLYSKFSMSNWVNYKSSDPDYVTFSAGVPYVLYAHKLHHGTMYEEWRGSPGLDKIFNPFHQAALLEPFDTSEFSADELLAMRPDCLIWGSKDQPITTWNIRKSGNARFDALPHQLRRMLLQTWVFSAEKRNKWVITDYNDWDAVAPLLEEVAQGTTNNPIIEDDVDLGEW